MEVRINVKKCLTLEITPNQYILAYLIYYQRSTLFKSFRKSYSTDLFFREDLLNLANKGYLKQESQDIKKIVFNETWIEGIFNDEPEIVVDDRKCPSSVEESDWDVFVNEFRDSFPSGVFTGSYRVKSSFKDCDAKLKKFVKEYPEHNQESIIKATKNYVMRCRLNGYKFMKLATYFIFKDKESILLSECEGIKEGSTQKSMFSSGI